MNHFASETMLAAAHDPSSAHNGGRSMVDTLLNGFLWRFGSDAANTVFHSAPTIFAGVALAAIAVAVVRRLRRRNQF
ncbi:hypothetical protein [Mycobacterium sp.]|uniref:hypothetical protein n=1 Tax=Mycobacterium sp. TaxID=1785 RepID=UPI0025E722B5|nr:hypothetical protein [Mycobacterium sp.]